MTTVGSPTIAHAATGTITITESLVPTTDTGLFNLTIDGATAGTGANVGNGGTTGSVTLTTTPSPGTVHTIGETAGTGTSLAFYQVAMSCNDGAVSFVTKTGNISVIDGANVTCNITSTKIAAGGGPVAQEVLGSGSDTTQFMMHQLDGLYLFSPGCQQIALPGGTKWFDFSCLTPDPAGTITTENYTHDQVHEAYFLGSGNGLHQVCNQNVAGNAHVDYARSSRAKAASDCAGMHFVAYARDGISWESFDQVGSGVHGMSNTTTTCAGSGGLTQFCLTQLQLQHIFLGGGPGTGTNGCTAFWDEDGIGGNHVPINPYTPQSGSGTRLTWDGFLGASSDACINTRGAAYVQSHIVDENQNASIATNGDALNVIFPFSAGVWKNQVNFKGGAQLGAIDNVFPSASTIGSGAFPFGRFLFNVFCAACPAGTNNASQATINYVGEDGWICKPIASHATNSVTGNNFRTDIGLVIQNSGFVPINFGPTGGGDPNPGFCRLTTTP
jgi:hypothetical protein